MDVPAELVALGAAGANTLVQSMATDAWQQVREQFAKLFSRDRESTQRSEERLDRSRTEILQHQDDRNEIIQLAVSEWSIRLRDLLEDQPTKVEDLHRILTYCEELIGANDLPAYPVNQIASARGSARIYQAGRDQILHDHSRRSK